jgi:NADH-quinone oxidoreductase subunit M
MLCAVPGIVAAAAYNLRMLQKVCYGTPNNRDYSAVADLNLREILTLAPLVVFIVWIGVHPQPFLDVMRDSLAHVLAQLGR